MVNCDKCGKKIGFLDIKYSQPSLNGKNIICCSSCNDSLHKTNVKKALTKNDKWEYKVFQIDTDRGALVASKSKIPAVEEKINLLGREGWELVSSFGLQSISAGLAVHSSGTTTSVAFVFKRKL